MPRVRLEPLTSRLSVPSANHCSTNPPKPPAYLVYNENVLSRFKCRKMVCSASKIILSSAEKLLFNAEIVFQCQNVYSRVKKVLHSIYEPKPCYRRKTCYLVSKTIYLSDKMCYTVAKGVIYYRKMCKVGNTVQKMYFSTENVY